MSSAVPTGHSGFASFTRPVAGAVAGFVAGARWRVRTTTRSGTG